MLVRLIFLVGLILFFVSFPCLTMQICYCRDTYNIFLMVPEQDSLLEMELVWVKVEQLQG